VTGEGIEDFKKALFRHAPASPEPAQAGSGQDLADYLVYRPAPRARRYRIFRTDTGFRVAGRPPGDEELAEALKAAGAKKGDEVAIGDELVEFS
jgi:hypothetical protein